MRTIEKERLANLVKINLTDSIKNNINKILQPQIDKNKQLGSFLTDIYYDKYYPELLKQVKQYAVDNNLITKNLSELIYLINNDLIKKPSCTCGNEITTFINYNNGYNQFCCAKCRNNDHTLIDKKTINYKKTVQEKYGVDNISQLQSIKDKKVKTMLQNYGVEYNSQRPEMRKLNSGMMSSQLQINKIKDGLVNSLGVSNPSLSQVILDKRQNTFDIKKLEKYKQFENKLNIIINSASTNNFNCYCNKCQQNFDINYNMFTYRFCQNLDICPIHNSYADNNISLKEKEIVNFIKSNYNGIILENDRVVLSGKELDIYLPELNIAFEFNGLYWHSELHKKPNFHINKTNKCKESGIRLIHIWEDQFIYKKEILYSNILAVLNKNKVINADDCVIKIVDIITYTEFIKENNLKGYITSTINYGLYYNNQLVYIMSFRKNKNNEYELVRFCNLININVINGFDKLFEYFIDLYPCVITMSIDIATEIFIDSTIFKFKLRKEYEPMYSWIISNKKRKNATSITKEKLIQNNLLLLNESIEECMYRLGHYRIYDCGSQIWEWKR